MTGIDAVEFRNPPLLTSFDDGAVATFTEIAVTEISRDRGHRLFPEFIERVRSMPGGKMLEIGSRALRRLSKRRGCRE